MVRTAFIPALILALLAFGALAPGARAQLLPALTPDQQATIALGVDASAPPVDAGFDALVAHVTSWDNEMKLWSAGVGRPSEFVQVAWLDGLVDGTVPQEIGTDALIYGRLIQRGPAPRRAMMERWVVEPLDTGRTTSTAKRPIVLYVVRTVSVVLGDPEPGWYVRAAARYAGIVDMPDLPRTTQTPSGDLYAAFVGATFDVSQRAGESAAGAIVWILLTVAVILGVLVLLIWIIQKSRRRDGDGSSAATSAVAPTAPKDRADVR